MSPLRNRIRAGARTPRPRQDGDCAEQVTSGKPEARNNSAYEGVRAVHLVFGTLASVLLCSDQINHSWRCGPGQRASPAIPRGGSPQLGTVHRYVRP
jgi:hypothetical protein